MPISKTSQTARMTTPTNYLRLADINKFDKFAEPLAKIQAVSHCILFL
ncbi:hypothetical protein CAMRE0001_1278 [Campylobacter rectus RM3267]|uniref:Uncharacterized protein n=1 Tax=Campylobacter rectus RM3267 TaxID=553218 RepID=B9CZX0_CAMRE|nr:hypothetical protein CAMRE0001_1278 [Campylobacter rectus RM3267]